MTDGPRHELGRVVRTRRLALGMSQRELADASGLSLGMLRDLEQERTRRPYPSTLRRLSQALGLDLQTRVIPPSANGIPDASEPHRHGPEVPTPVRFLILGVMEAAAHGTAVRLGSGKVRTLAAYLALNAGAVIDRDTLIDLLWDDMPPSYAEERVGEYVRKAREILCPAAAGSASRRAPSLIERVGRGYRLRKDMCHRDADEFLDLSDRGRAALGNGQPGEAADLLDRALRLWRGEVMPEIEAVKDHPEVVSLRRRRSGTVQDIADALSALGRCDEALTHLEAAAARDPFDESMQGRLLLTLARCGRQSEALSRYQRFSHLLHDELGVRPGRDLAEVQQRILHQKLEPASGIALRSVVVPRQLPAVSALFTGRDTELRAVVDHVERTATDSDFATVPIVAIDGMAGVGKTAFAVRAAHHLADRFPDGQIFADLHGLSTDLPPRHPHQVLEELIHALGVPLPLIPADPVARAVLYQDRLARTRTLIVLDNAAAADQVRPLLPASGRCMVLVTSRRRLKSLDEARPITLDALRDEDAHQLLTQMVPRTSEIGSAESLRDLASLCGKLPLALRIVGALLRQRPWLTPITAADRLRSSLNGPDPLSIFDDGDRSLRSIFDLSYDALHPQQQGMLRALGTMPGPDIDAYAAAALADTDVGTAESLLVGLVDHNLLVETAPGRFQLHDLIRLYAGTRSAEHSRSAAAAAAAAATERLLAHFEITAARADRFISRNAPAAGHRPAPETDETSPRFESREQAMAWMHRDAPNLAAAAHLATALGDHRRVVSLAASLYAFLRIHGPWSESLELLEVAVGAADADADPVSGAAARTRLGVIRRLAGDFAGSVTALRAAVDRLRADDSSRELATAFRELGETYRVKGDFKHAEEALRSALAQRGLATDPLGRAGALTSLGSLALTWDSDPLAAIDLLHEAVGIYRENADRTGMVTALCYLGDLHRALGDYPEARRILESALDDARGADDVLVQANVLVRLGYLRYLLGDHGAADYAFYEALDMYVRLGSLVGEANTLTYIGTTRLALGERANAVDILHRALDIYTTLGNDRGRAMALMYTAQAMQDGGRHDDAASALAQAIRLFQEAGDTLNEAYALTVKGAFALADGAADDASAHYGQALGLARRGRRRVTEAIALRGMGTAAVADGNVIKGIESLKSALEIYRSLGSPHAEAVETEVKDVLARAESLRTAEN